MVTFLFQRPYTQLWRGYTLRKCTFGLSHDDVRTLFQHCLDKNAFRFDDKSYRQTLGIAMGNPCAPPIALLFLDRFQRKALENLQEAVILCRYSTLTIMRGFGHMVSSHSSTLWRT